MKYLIIFLLSINLTFANDAVYLEKEKPAPFSGYLITHEKAEKIRLLTIDLNLANKTSDILTKENDLLNKQVDISHKRIEDMSKELVESRDSAIWSKIGFFMLGVAAATLTTFGISRATR